MTKKYIWIITFFIYHLNSPSFARGVSFITLPNACKTIEIKNWNPSIEFGNIFNEGSIINFDAQKKMIRDNQNDAFTKNLCAYLSANPIVEDFDSKNIINLINYPVFENAQWYVDSSWVEFFIELYHVDADDLEEVLASAISSEDINAVAIILKHGYIVSNVEILEASNTKNNSDIMKGYNLYNKGVDERGEPTFYISENSSINKIIKMLNCSYRGNLIKDKDGFTNLRFKSNTDSIIVQKLNNGSAVYVLKKYNDWLKIISMEGNIGYIHRSRLETKNCYSQ